MKKWLLAIPAVLLLCTAAFVIAGKVKGTQNTPDRPEKEALEAFMESPLYAGGEIVFEKEGIYSQTHPELHPISEGGEYIYWINDEGFVRFIAEREPCTPEGGVPCGKEKASSAAGEWFDKVFFREEEALGKEKEIETADFDGGTYLVTVDLMLGEMQTGNTASLSVAADGKLVSAVFVKGRLTPDEVRKEIRISAAEAVERAKQALLEDSREYYKDREVLHHMDRLHDVRTKCRTWQEDRYWQVEFTVPTDGILQETMELYCVIRIDADTGECLEVATSAK